MLQECWNYQNRNSKRNCDSYVRALMGKGDNMQRQMNNISKEMKILRKKSNRNSRDQKRCNRNEECF